MPVSGTWQATTHTVTLTFSGRLQPGLSAPANWSGVAFDVGFANFTTPGPVTIAGFTVTFTAALGFPALGPNRVTYSPPPFDVISLGGVPAPPFADFPLTAVP